MPLYFGNTKGNSDVNLCLNSVPTERPTDSFLGIDNIFEQDNIIIDGQVVIKLGFQYR